MRILDATCGKRIMWFDKNYPDTVYIDLRPEVKPDIICDCTRSPFKDKVFDLIVFDPPHHNMGANSDMGKRYGHFTMAEIRILLLRAFFEFSRILEDNGLILFKWNTHDYSLEKVLMLIGSWFMPLFGQKVSIRQKHISLTYWVCLIKTKHNNSSPTRR